ncbi:hypothetical protein ACIP5Y_36925 [Nocardia sp. NPDC088792]|uniref:hypothetical protein n=1 Tax=Nocardia sp. NPDC088792 TaxID=3364332 RepID=UPI00381BDDC2
MPSNNHEVPLELFRERPELAAKIARDVFGLPVPEDTCWRLGPETVTALGPLELHLDVALVGGRPERPNFAIIQEVQNTCTADDLARIGSSWPEYVTSLRKRLACPVVLLAYCPTERVAAAVGRPIQTGHPGFVFTPITYWPGRLAAITDPEQAREWPELVLLSAPGHLQDESRHQVLEMVLKAVETFGPERGLIYYDYISARLPEAVRAELEELMTISIENYRWESEFAQRHQAIGRAEGVAEGRAEGVAEGRAEGEAVAVLTVLGARAIPVDNSARERILACSDLEQLSEWLTRAVTVTAVSQLFDSV